MSVLILQASGDRTTAEGPTLILSQRQNYLGHWEEPFPSPTFETRGSKIFNDYSIENVPNCVSVKKI